jgi:hypothetical protein
MRRHARYLVLLCSALLSLSAHSFAVDSLAANSAFLFLDEPVIPRLVGMGYAGTAFDNGGFSFVNPAQPALADQQSIEIGYAPMPGDLNTPFFEIGWGFPDFFLSVHGSNYAIDNIIPTDAVNMPNPSAPFSYGFSLLSINGGYKSERGAIALTVNGMQERIETSSRYGYSVSIGGLYRLIPNKLCVGLAMLNEGKTTAFTYSSTVTGTIDEQGEQENLPRSGRLGFAYSDTLGRIPINAACDIVYHDERGATYSGKSVASRTTLPLGVEVWPTDYVALRLGKRINFETEVVNFGAGLRFRPLNFDMAFVVSQFQGDIEVKPMFGLTYALGSVPAKTKPSQMSIEPVSKPPEPPRAASRQDSVSISPPKPQAPAPVRDTPQTSLPSDSLTILKPVAADSAHPAASAPQQIAPITVPSLPPDSVKTQTPDMQKQPSEMK